MVTFREDRFQSPTSCNCPCLELINIAPATKLLGERTEAMQNGTCPAQNGEQDVAPILLGTTRHEPDLTAKNILVTGGAGFM